MKNKVELNKMLIRIGIVFIIMILIFVIINALEYRVYVSNYNNKIVSIVSGIKEKYPDISDNDIMKILNDNNKKVDFFDKYGFDIEKESIILENDKNFYLYLLFEIIVFVLLVSISICVYLKYDKKKSKDIEEIIELVDKINHRNYELKIEEITEDELSILKHEIYKTMLMLREETDNSLSDKLELKKFIEDISHQLKTPLTSILINLDNLIDNPDLEKEKKERFLREIKNKIFIISFLIESLLKLSKFEVNTIEFNSKEENVKQLIELSLNNVVALADLKNIKINVNGNDMDKINCDLKWQVEAITNILKNAIEHSKENSEVDVDYESNSIYTQIIVKNFGNRISRKDLLHIFERFYKGENSSEDSVGIGLALSKAIIEKDNGRITVKSDEKETVFIIKYFVMCPAK